MKITIEFEGNVNEFRNLHDLMKWGGNKLPVTNKVFHDSESDLYDVIQVNEFIFLEYNDYP